MGRRLEPREHPGQLHPPLGVVQDLDRGRAGVLADPDVPIREAGDLGQVRHHDHLADPGEPGQARPHRDLIANNFSLKTIFGWATDKELDRYTRDFAREDEAKGMLIKLGERHKAAR